MRCHLFTYLAAYFFGPGVASMVRRGGEREKGKEVLAWDIERRNLHTCGFTGFIQIRRCPGSGHLHFNVGGQPTALSVPLAGVWRAAKCNFG